MGSWIWRDLLNKLPGKILAFDQRSNNSEKKDYSNISFQSCLQYHIEEISKIPHREIVIVAHSLSGVLGLKLAHRLSDDVAHLFLLSANIPPVGMSVIDTFPKEQAARLIEFQHMHATAGLIPYKQLKELVTQTLCNFSSKDVCNYVLEQSSQPEPNCMLSVINTPNKQFAGKITYICTQKDNSLEVLKQKEMSTRLNAQLKEIEADHMSMLSFPQKLAATIVSQLNL